MNIKEIYSDSDILDDESFNSKFVNFSLKVVSFELGSDNYLIDIMQVKEIRKSSNFTYVPNARKYVVGLDNLRGDIIPIIDLRIMFGLKSYKKELENNIMVLKNDELIIGVIVDKINNVFSINSNLIQDPHPVLSQDSLIKYIKGVVEYSEKLYILLDVGKVFNHSEEENSLGNVRDFYEKVSSVNDSCDENIGNVLKNDLSDNISSKNNVSNPIFDHISDFNFNLDDIKKNLLSHSFNSSLVNDEFLKTIGLYSNNINDLSYDNFLKKFYSKSSGHLWKVDYLNEFKYEIIGKYVHCMNGVGSILNVLEIGCGNGKEAVALSSALHEFYGESFKLTAIDNDFQKIVETSKLTFLEFEIDASTIYKKNSFEFGSGVYKFKAEILNNILFEYSDAFLSDLPDNLGMVFLKDVLCFLSNEDQILMLDIVTAKMLEGALLILGDNEELKNNNVFEKEKSVKCFNLYRKILRRN